MDPKVKISEGQRLIHVQHRHDECFGCICSALISLVHRVRSHTQMREHASEDGQSCWRLLIQSSKCCTWKPLQVLERGERRDWHFESVNISSLEVLPVYFQDLDVALSIYFRTHSAKTRRTWRALAGHQGQLLSIPNINAFVVQIHWQDGGSQICQIGMWYMAIEMTQTIH